MGTDRGLDSRLMFVNDLDSNKNYACCDYEASWMSQISARNGGSSLFCLNLMLKHISEFMLPNVRNSVKMASSLAKCAGDPGGFR